MTVKVTDEKPNNFPSVEIVDARSSNRGAEIILGTRVEGQLVRVTVTLSQTQVSTLIRKLSDPGIMS